MKVNLLRKMSLKSDCYRTIVHRPLTVGNNQNFNKTLNYGFN